MQDQLKIKGRLVPGEGSLARVQTAASLLCAHRVFSWGTQEGRETDASLSLFLHPSSFPLCFPYKVLQPRLWSPDEASYSTKGSMDKSHIPLSLSTHLPVPGLGIINHPVLPTSDCKGNQVPTTQPSPHPRQPGGSSP